MDTIQNDFWSTVSETTHKRVFVEAGNGSHFIYVLKDIVLGLLEYPVSWIAPGEPGWQSQS